MEGVSRYDGSLASQSLLTQTAYSCLCYMGLAHKTNIKAEKWDDDPSKIFQVSQDEGPVVKHRHGMSEFTDTADHRRKGLNTWQDSSGSIRDY